MNASSCTLNARCLRWLTAPVKVVREVPNPTFAVIQDATVIVANEHNFTKLIDCDMNLPSLVSVTNRAREKVSLVKFCIPIERTPRLLPSPRCLSFRSSITLTGAATAVQRVVVGTRSTISRISRHLSTVHWDRIDEPGDEVGRSREFGQAIMCSVRLSECEGRALSLNCSTR